LKRWWSGKYSLPPQHELFQSQTIAELRTEWYGDLWSSKADIESQLESADFDSQGPLQERLKAICAILEETSISTDDPLVAYWEEQVARGEHPDLDMTLEDLKRLKG